MSRVEAADLDMSLSCRLSVRLCVLGTVCPQDELADCRTVWNATALRTHMIDCSRSIPTTRSIRRPLIHIIHRIASVILFQYTRDADDRRRNETVADFCSALTTSIHSHVGLNIISETSVFDIKRTCCASSYFSAKTT